MKRSIKQQRESGGRELEPSSSGLMERMSMPSFKGYSFSLVFKVTKMKMKVFTYDFSVSSYRYIVGLCR